MNNVQTAHVFLAEADLAIGKAIGTLAKVPRSRVVAWSQRGVLAGVQKTLRGVRNILPKS